MSEIVKTDLAERIEQLIEETKKRTVATINTAMVYTYYEISIIGYEGSKLIVYLFFIEVQLVELGKLKIEVVVFIII